MIKDIQTAIELVRDRGIREVTERFIDRYTTMYSRGKFGLLSRKFIFLLASPLINRKIREKKRHMNELGAEYIRDPETTAIVQFFNQRAIIPSLHRTLRNSGFDEIIVIDDGSVDGATREWKKRLDRPNEILLVTNDLHEVTTYQRAMELANGEFVCLLQDDDLPPEDEGWVTDAIHLFEQFSDMVILGGWLGVTPETGSRNSKPSQDDRRTYNLQTISNPEYSHDGIDFMFVPTVNRSPMWLRRSDFLRDVGIDQSFAPYLYDDMDACFRAWDQGYTVGLYDPDFLMNVIEGGMRAYKSEGEFNTQVNDNWEKIVERYSDEIEKGVYENLSDDANDRFR